MRARGRTLSLRARLLIGLIALIAVFLVVMGTVSTVVLGRLEQDQFNAELRLAARQPVVQLAEVDRRLRRRLPVAANRCQSGELTQGSPTAAELRDAAQQGGGRARPTSPGAPEQAGAP